MDGYDRDNAIRELTDEHGSAVTPVHVREYLDDYLFGGEWNEHDVDDITAAVRDGGRR